MAHFYGDLQGSRGPATRMGGMGSGIRAHVRGWDVGVRVIGRYDEATGRDVFDVYETSGSNGSSSDRLIATVER